MAFLYRQTRDIRGEAGSCIYIIFLISMYTPPTGTLLHMIFEFSNVPPLGPIPGCAGTTFTSPGNFSQKLHISTSISAVPGACQFKEYLSHLLYYLMCLSPTVPVSLDQKSDSEPATGHQFFCLKHGFAISKYFNPFLISQ
jgi:hypothetical protein